MKEKDLKNKELYKESKRLFMETFKNYLKYWLILIVFAIAIILLFFYLKPEFFQYISWTIVIINIFITSLFLVIFDGIPARKIRKSDFSIKGLDKRKNNVFYNALKLRTIFRGLLNSFGVLITLLLSIILMVI